MSLVKKNSIPPLLFAGNAYSLAVARIVVEVTAAGEKDPLDINCSSRPSPIWSHLGAATALAQQRLVPVPGLEDTELGVFIEPEVGHGTTTAYSGVKLEAVKLIRDRGVSYAQAARDLGVHQSMLRNWVKAFGDDPQQAFPGHGQQKPEQAEIARLKREVTKLKAERDILKKPRPTSRRKRREVQLHREAPGDLAGGMVCAGRSGSRGVAFTPG